MSEVYDLNKPKDTNNKSIAIRRNIRCFNACFIVLFFAEYILHVLFSCADKRGGSAFRLPVPTTLLSDSRPILYSASLLLTDAHTDTHTNTVCGAHALTHASTYVRSTYLLLPHKARKHFLFLFFPFPLAGVQLISVQGGFFGNIVEAFVCIV